MTQEDEPPRSEGVQYATGKEQRTIINSFRKNETGQTGNDAKLWKCLVVKVNSEQYKEQYCIGT